MGSTTFNGPVTSTNGFVGALTGNVTGNVTGDLTGDVTGDIQGGVTLTTEAGTGITTATGYAYISQITRVGNLVSTHIFVDLTGLNSGDTDGDIIGKAATANSHFGKLDWTECGQIVSGSIACLETPAGGEPDIDVYCATEATGTEDAAITGLAEEALLASAADWTIGVTKALTAVPSATNKYLYLVASGGATDDTYTAGQFLIVFNGYLA